MAPSKTVWVEVNDVALASWEEAKRQNPNLLERLADVVRRAQVKGLSHWSIDAALHVLRFETPVTTGGSCFKINNNISSVASRDLLSCYPQFEGFLKTRVRRPQRGWVRVQHSSL